MLRAIKPAIRMLVVLTVLTGIAYPLLVTVIAQAAFPRQANGSLVERDGTVIGSTLIGQAFEGAKYFHSRPSSAGVVGYDGMASGGSNLAVTSRLLVDRVTDSVAALRASGAVGPVPVDLVTTSGSGLDPDITPAGAELQAPPVAAARGMSLAAVRELIRRNTTPRQLGVLGEPRVNVLALNLALDELSNR